MSWLSDFTSKAENLLTKFDQTAAQTLSESVLQTSEDDTNSVKPNLQESTPSVSPPSPLNASQENKEYQNASQLFSSQPKQQPLSGVRQTADPGILSVCSLFGNNKIPF